MRPLTGATVVDCLAQRLRAQPGTPLLTAYDDASGERVELSGVTLAQWAAKTANLLVDGYAVGPGDRAVLDLPAHWMTPGILLGCWIAGLAVQFTPPAARAAIAFVAADEVKAPGRPAAGDVLGLSLRPMGLGLAAAVAGVDDYAAAVPGYGDTFSGPPPSPGDVALVDCGTLSHAEVVAAGAGLLVPGDRALLSTERADRTLVFTVAAVLIAGGSLVLVTHADPGAHEHRVAAERITRVLAASP